MTSYFKIDFATTEKEVGSTYPQSQTARHPVHTDDPRYIGKQDIGCSLPAATLPEPVLHPDAKRTDLISNTSLGSRLLVSTRLKTLMQPHLQKAFTQILPVTLHHLIEAIGYWLLNPVSFHMDLIDYSRSEIWLHTVGNTKVERLNFDSHAAFEEYRQKLVLPERAHIEKPVFLATAQQDFVQLRFVAGGIGFYVSQNLKEEIENAECTGLRFTAMV